MAGDAHEGRGMGKDLLQHSVICPLQHAVAMFSCCPSNKSNYLKYRRGSHVTDFTVTVFLWDVSVTVGKSVIFRVFKYKSTLTHHLCQWLGLPCICLTATTDNGPDNSCTRHCGWCAGSPIGFQSHSNSTYPIWRQKKKKKHDPNNASSSASGYRANAHTQVWTQMHTICVFPSLEELRSRHVSPWITLKEKAVEEILFLSGKTQSILIWWNNTLTCCVLSHSILFLSLNSVFFPLGSDR